MRFPRRVIQDSRLKRLAGLLLVLGLVGIAFYSTPLLDLFKMVLRREGSSHGVFVPLLSLCFIWRKRSKLRYTEAKYEIVPGLVLVAGGLLLFSLVRAYDQFYWECVSFVTVLAGFVICFFGKDVFKEVAFAVFFLIFMIPIPEQLYNAIANWVRQGTIGASTQFLALIGVPLLREDLLIHLPNTTLSINIGCSGIRYLLSYFVFGIAYAYLFGTNLYKRIFIVSLTIPISLLASTLRLTSIALLTYYIGPHMAEHWPHVITSWSVFFFVLVFFVGLDQWMASRRSGTKYHQTNHTNTGGILR